MTELTETLTVTIGPISGHADGALAIIALFGIVMFNIVWTAVAARFVRRMDRQNPEVRLSCRVQDPYS